MRIFFSVGEPSGDLHAANLIKHIKARVGDFQAVGFAGPKMRAAGCECLDDLTTIGVMFLAAVFRHIRLFFKLIADADAYFSANSVDAVVLIDYPGLNWWIARKAKKHNIPVYYYGVPQMWAWAPWRIKKIRRYVDHVICKLPFEPKWFAERGCQAHYVGHPYFDQLSDQNLDSEFINQAQIQSATQPVVLLLPGSRKIELKNNLSTLITAAKKIRQQMPNVRIVVGALNDEFAERCTDICTENQIEVFSARTQELMSVATVCIACSGSVCLELLWHRVPTVVVYKITWLKYWLQSVVLQCKFITLTNLMTESDIRKTNWWPYDPDAVDAQPVLVPEYLSPRDCSDGITKKIIAWLSSKELLADNRDKLEQLAERYANPGATSRAADYIMTTLPAAKRKPAAA